MKLFECYKKRDIKGLETLLKTMHPDSERDAGGFTLLHKICDHMTDGDEKYVELLLRHKADPNITNINKKNLGTPFDGIFNRFTSINPISDTVPKIASLLLEYGAYKKYSPQQLNWLEHNNHKYVPEVVQLFRQHGLFDIDESKAISQSKIRRQVKIAKGEEAQKQAAENQRKIEAERQAEVQKQAKEARQIEIARQETQRLAELAKQVEEARKIAEAAKKTEAEKQAKLEAERQEELKRQAEAAARKAEIARQEARAELARQAEEARKIAEAAKQAEAEKQAKLEEQRQAELKREAEEAAKQAEIAREDARTELARQAEEASPDINLQEVLSYAQAIFTGVKNGTISFVDDMLHPIDNILYPMSELVVDASFIAIASIVDTLQNYLVPEDINILHAILKKDSGLYQEAVLRMHERVNALKTSWTGFKQASDLERVEKLSELGTTLFAPGFVVRSARYLTNYKPNYKHFGQLSPPTFEKQRGKSRSLDWLVDPIKINDIRDGLTPNVLMYVIDKNRKLIINRLNRGDWHLDHSVLGQGKGVYAAGDLYLEKGKIVSIDSRSGTYAPQGEHLGLLVEHAFVKDGFSEAKGKFIDWHKKILPNLEPGKTLTAPNISHDKLGFTLASGAFFKEFYKQDGVFSEHKKSINPLWTRAAAMGSTGEEKIATSPPVLRERLKWAGYHPRGNLKPKPKRNHAHNQLIEKIEENRVMKIMAMIASKHNFGSHLAFQIFLQIYEKLDLNEFKQKIDTAKSRAKHQPRTIRSGKTKLFSGSQTAKHPTKANGSRTGSAGFQRKSQTNSGSSSQGSSTTKLFVGSRTAKHPTKANGSRAGSAGFQQKSRTNSGSNSHSTNFSKFFKNPLPIGTRTSFSTSTMKTVGTDVAESKAQSKPAARSRSRDLEKFNLFMSIGSLGSSKAKGRFNNGDSSVRRQPPKEKGSTTFISSDRWRRHAELIEEIEKDRADKIQDMIDSNCSFGSYDGFKIFLDKNKDLKKQEFAQKIGDEKSKIASKKAAAQAEMTRREIQRQAKEADRQFELSVARNTHASESNKQGNNSGHINGWFYEKAYGPSA